MKNFLSDSSRSLVGTDISSGEWPTKTCVFVCVKPCVKRVFLMAFLVEFPTNCAGWNPTIVCVMLCVNFESEIVVVNGKMRHFFDTHKIKKPWKLNTYKAINVPGTGFEPAQPFGCCHLKTVRLPISPPGQVANVKSKFKSKKQKSTRLPVYFWLFKFDFLLF